MALKKGFYRQEGLDVRLKPADKDTDVVDEVVSGRAQYGVGTSGIIVERQEGKPIVVLGGIFQKVIKFARNSIQKRVKAFIRATILGWLYVIGSPEDTVELIAKEYPESALPDKLLLQLKSIIPSFLTQYKGVILISNWQPKRYISITRDVYVF